MTLWHWVSRLEANSKRAVEYVGEKRYRVWRIYMAGSAHAFDRGWISIYQILGAKPLANGSLPYLTNLRVHMFTKRTDRLPASRAAILVILIIFVGACASAEAPSESTRRSNDPVSTAQPKAPWSEMNAPLPPYPQAANLAEFKLSGGTSFKFFADLTSVRVDADGVVRYTVIARSASGIENVSFEGIHCESGEYKVYAYGSTDDRTWILSRNPKWQAISGTSNNNLRQSLRLYYLCPNGLPHNNAKDAVAVLKSGRPYFGDYRGF